MAWFEIVFGASGIVRLTGEIIDKYFLPYPGGDYILAMMFVNAVMGLLGPVGLFLGLRHILSGRGIESRTLGWTLTAVPVIVNFVGSMAARFWGPPDFDVSLTAARRCQLMFAGNCAGAGNTTHRAPWPVSG